MGQVDSYFEQLNSVAWERSQNCSGGVRERTHLDNSIFLKPITKPAEYIYSLFFTWLEGSFLALEVDGRM